jgi:FtsP/CotA-like multicopper oxidase with cupredoxin domain
VSPSPSGSPSPTLPAGWTDHDLAAQIKVRRFVGNLAGDLGISDLLDNVLGPNAEPPEFTKVPYGNQPLEPTSVDADGTKVFDLTVDEIDWKIDAELPPVKAFGYNEMWPGPLMRVTEGDKVRMNFTNNLQETTAVHFHGIEFDDHRMDGVPFVNQLPIIPGETFSYEFVAKPSGSHMYHSHHNATDQVGRGLLGAFIVDPKDPEQSYADMYGVTQDIVFIHNDAWAGSRSTGTASRPPSRSSPSRARRSSSGS